MSDQRICAICDGGPGNEGVCLCGHKAYITPKPQSQHATSSVGAVLLPCKISCPKCGSSDIARVFRERQERWMTYSGEHVRTNRFVVVNHVAGLCLEDVITHHCRMCRWDWETPPLATLARQEAARMIDEAVTHRSEKTEGGR